MKEELRNLKKAIDGLEGVEIPYNITKRYIYPLHAWLKNLEEVNKESEA